MRILITGGAGFIGSNAAAAYLREGAEVTLFDDLRRRGTDHNLAWLRSLGRRSLTFVRGDVRDPAAVRDAVEQADPSFVLHLAAQPAVTTSIERPREDLETNLLGTFNVLEAIRTRRRPPGLLFTSTNKVYGSLPHRETVETPLRHRFADEGLHARGISEDEPLDFHSPYGCSKGAADQYVRDYARIYGLETVVFRMSCIYGQRQFGNEDQGWLAHFLIAVALRTPLTVYGDGKQVRDLLHVDDLISAIRAAHERLPELGGSVFNIGGGPANALSVWTELRPLLERFSARVPEPLRAGPRPGDQPVYVSDTSRAQRALGWEPRISAQEGLQRLWKWISDGRPEIEEALGVRTLRGEPAPA